MDNSAISIVELFIDGEAIDVLSMSPYEYDWDTTELDDLSMHTIYAKAVDDGGHAKEIFIKYEPSIWLDLPAIKMRLIYFTRDGTVYFIIAAANERAYPLYESDFDEVIETFEFL